MEGFRRQQNKHHRFTIYRHILETMDLTKPELRLRLTALFHDIAKPRVREKSEGVWRFIGHEQAGADMTQEIMRRLRFSSDEIRDVTHLIKHHMLNYDSSWSDGAVRRFIRRIGPEPVYDLISFRKSDLIAHGREDSEHNILSELEERVGQILRAKTAGINKSLAIDGNRVMEMLGLEPGPEVGKILQDLLERVTDQPELNNEYDLIRILIEKSSNDDKI